MNFNRPANMAVISLALVVVLGVVVVVRLLKAEAL